MLKTNIVSGSTNWGRSSIFNDQMIPISYAGGLVDLSTSDPLTLNLDEGFQLIVKKIGVSGVGSFVQLEISKGEVSTTALYDLTATHPFHVLKIGSEKAQAQCVFEQ